MLAKYGKTAHTAGVAEDRSYTAGLRTALVSLSRGTCYWPACPEPITRLVDGKHIVALQIAHICAVEPGGPRYDSEMSGPDRNDFPNLMFMCYFHHKTIDLNGGPQYPVELLRRWKSDRETPRQAALRGLQSLTEEKLQSLISEAFTEHDTQIKDTLGRLEENDQEAAGVLRELLAELTELRNRGSVLDADLVGQLDSAAQMLGHLQDTAGALQDASERLGHLQDTAGTLLAGAQALGRIPDLGELASLIDRLESAATSLRNIEGWS